MIKSSSVVKFTIYDPVVAQSVELAKKKKVLSVLVVNALQHYLASAKGKEFAKRLKQDAGGGSPEEGGGREETVQGVDGAEAAPDPPARLNIDSFLGGV